MVQRTTTMTAALLSLLSLVQLVSSHVVLTYPGWRGDTLMTNGTPGLDDYKDNAFPYGMQWSYPCGGIGLSDNPNRTYWPITGGAVAFQPGWFTGHKTALLYINLGIGNQPVNYSLIMQPMFQIIGPTNDAYPGLEVCMPQVPLPANLTVKEGDNATIQVVENAKHGAALFGCVDITFTADMSKVQKVNHDNCRNDSAIQFASLYSTASTPIAGVTSVSAAAANLPRGSSIIFSTVVLAAATAWFAL